MRVLKLIKKAAEEVGVTPGTLRDYERQGLISPARDTAGRRLYTEVDVAEARKVAAQRLKNRGSGLRHVGIEAA